MNYTNLTDDTEGPDPEVQHPMPEPSKPKLVLKEDSFWTFEKKKNCFVQIKIIQAKTGIKKGLNLNFWEEKKLFCPG